MYSKMGTSQQYLLRFLLFVVIARLGRLLERLTGCIRRLIVFAHAWRTVWPCKICTR